jgi:hypothetical protein
MILIPIIVLLLRLNTASIQNYGYQINQTLFPVMVRAQVMGVCNLVSRPLSAMATIVNEYTSTPEWFIIASIVVLLFAV